MTFSRILAAALMAAAVAAPAAAAQTTDTLENALAQERSYSSSGDPVQDLRSPDTRDAAEGRAAYDTGETAAPVAPRDLRMPDTRDAAIGRGTLSAPDVTVIRVPPQPLPSSSGIDWRDAGAGAGIALVLSLVALGGVFAVVHHRQGGRTTAATG